MKLTLIAALLVSVLALGQADQSATTPQPTGQQPISQPPTTPSVKPRPTTPHPVVDAARASRQLQESAPPAKVYRNKDVKDPATSPPGPAVSQTLSLPASQPAVQNTAQTADAEIQKDRAFEAQGKVFQSQILVEKGKIGGIQNHMTSLKYQFDAWSTEYSQDSDAPACWTSAYYSPYYRDWCDTGRNLKAQYDASQR